MNLAVFTVLAIYRVSARPSTDAEKRKESATPPRDALNRVTPMMRGDLASTLAGLLVGLGRGGLL